MLRHLHHTQPDSFAFTPENLKWAEAQIAPFMASIAAPLFSKRFLGVFMGALAGAGACAALNFAVLMAV